MTSEGTAKENESAIPLPKIDPVRGSLHVEWKRCGRSNCRCQDGRLHGPYYTRHWREDGRQRKAYVRVQDVPIQLVGIELRRAMLPSASSMKRLLRGRETRGPR
jgi:hypothetical protein